MKTDDSRDMGDPDSSAPMTFADHVHHLADVLASDLGADLCDPDDDASRPGDVRKLRLMHDLACGAGADCPGHDGGARDRREDDPGLPDEVRLLAESLMGDARDPRDPMRPFAEIARGNRHAGFSEGGPVGYAMFRGGGAKAPAKPAPGKSAPHASAGSGGCGTGAGGFKAGNTCGHAKHRNATVEAARSAHTAARAEVSSHLKAHRKAVKDAAKSGGAAPAPKELHAAVRKAAAAHAGYRAARETHKAEQRDKRNAARREGRKAKKAEGGKPTPKATIHGKEVNAGGQRADGLTSTARINALKSTPMGNGHHGYEIHDRTQELAKKLQSDRNAKAKELRDARRSPGSAGQAPVKGSRGEMAAKIKQARADARTNDPAVAAKIAEGKARADRRDAQQGKLNLAGAHATPPAARAVPPAVARAIGGKRLLRDQADRHRATKGDRVERLAKLHRKAVAARSPRLAEINKASVAEKDRLDRLMRAYKAGTKEERGQKLIQAKRDARKAQVAARDARLQHVPTSYPPVISGDPSEWGPVKPGSIGHNGKRYAKK